MRIRLRDERAWTYFGQDTRTYLTERGWLQRPRFYLYRNIPRPLWDLVGYLRETRSGYCWLEGNLVIGWLWDRLAKPPWEIVVQTFDWDLLLERVTVYLRQAPEPLRDRPWTWRVDSPIGEIWLRRSGWWDGHTFHSLPLREDRLWRPNSVAALAWDPIYKWFYNPMGTGLTDAWEGQWNHREPWKPFRCDPVEVLLGVTEHRWRQWGWTVTPLYQALLLDWSQHWTLDEAWGLGDLAALADAFWRMLRRPHPYRALQWWHRLGALAWLIPPWAATTTRGPWSLQSAERILRTVSTMPQLTYRVAALFAELGGFDRDHGAASAALWEAWAKAWRVSPRLTGRVATLIRHHAEVPGASQLAQRVRWRRILTQDGRRQREDHWLARHLPRFQWRLLGRRWRKPRAAYRWLRGSQRGKAHRYPAFGVHRLRLDPGFWDRLGVHDPATMAQVLDLLVRGVRRRHLRNHPANLFAVAAYACYGPTWIDRFPEFVRSLYAPDTDWSRVPNAPGAAPAPPALPP